MTEIAIRWSLHALSALAAIAVVVGVVLVMIRAMAKPHPPLPGGLVGETGTALTAVSRKMGRVQVAGREVMAIADEEIAAGRAVRVVQVDGLVAKVAPAN